MKMQNSGKVEFYVNLWYNKQVRKIFLQKILPNQIASA